MSYWDIWMFFLLGVVSFITPYETAFMTIEYEPPLSSARFADRDFGRLESAVPHFRG